jgi:hypothetical protein
MDDAKMRNIMDQATGDFKLARKIARGEFYINDFLPAPSRSFSAYHCGV